MKDGGLAVPFGIGGGAVEVDETFIGKIKGIPKRAAYHHKMKVLTLVDRTTGQARSTVVENLTQRRLGQIMRKNISQDARLMTDEAPHYTRLGKDMLITKSCIMARRNMFAVKRTRILPKASFQFSRGA